MRLLADENFHGDIVRGLLRVEPKLDLLSVQDTEVYQASDADVLAYAAVENRILLTHDVQTLTRYAYERVREGLAMPGVIEVAHDIAIGQAIEEILIVVVTSTPEQLSNQIIYIPLQ